MTDTLPPEVEQAVQEALYAADPYAAEAYRSKLNEDDDLVRASHEALEQAIRRVALCALAAGREQARITEIRLPLNPVRNSDSSAARAEGASE